MSTGAISGSSAVDAATGAFGKMSSSDFIKIMTSELSHQDPLQPQDSGKLLDQISSLRNIESQLSLQEQLAALVSQNQIAQAGGMIGKVVAGLDSNNNQIQGVVTSVQVQDNKALLQLDSGQSLEMGRVTQIANKPATTTTQGS